VTAPRDRWPGAFVSFEGADGVGKSTQIALAAERLKRAGRDVVVTREPGGTAGGEAIRALLVRGPADRWSAMSEALLMYAARADHIEKVIAPALSRGAVVLCDRFADSSMAYQGVAGGLGAGVVGALDRIVVGDRTPDLTVILDAPVALAASRASGRGGVQRFESKGAEFQQAVRAAFLDIARAAPERCVVIDASGAPDAVAGRIWTAIARSTELLGSQPERDDRKAKK
jgi:dTMP kinase